MVYVIKQQQHAAGVARVFLTVYEGSRSAAVHSKLAACVAVTMLHQQSSNCVQTVCCMGSRSEVMWSSSLCQPWRRRWLAGHLSRQLKAADVDMW